MQIRLQRTKDEKGLSQSVSQSVSERGIASGQATYGVDNHGCENRGGYRGPVLGIFEGACVGWVVAL